MLWGLTALFIAVPEVLAALSKTLKADIPWPTISNLTGTLERGNHWVALIVVGVIAAVAAHTMAYPETRKRLGRALRENGRETSDWSRGGLYIVFLLVAGIVAGGVAAAFGATKSTLGYAIYVTLTVFGVVVPSALAYWAGKVLDIPTLFATLRQLNKRLHWVTIAVVALLAVLVFHLALYPWPNYSFLPP